MAKEESIRLCNESQYIYGSDVFPFFDIEDDEWEDIESKIEFCVNNKINRDRAKKYAKKRFLRPGVRLSHNMTMAIYISLRGNKKGQHWEDLVGYTLGDLIKRLKKTLPKGVTWEDFTKNRSKSGAAVPSTSGRRA